MTARCTRCGKHWIISIQQPLKCYICPYCSMRDKLIQKGILKERKKGMEKLKVCALCGKPAIIEKWSSGGMMYMAKCSNPKCQVGEEITCTKGHDLKRVIEEWNLIQERVKS